MAPDLSGEDLIVSLNRYLAERRVDDAATARSREWVLRQLAEEEMLLAGVLLDLAERSEAVVVQTWGGRTHRGRVRGVGRDFVALRTGAGHVLVHAEVVVSVRAEGAPPVGSGRAHALDIALGPALAAVAGDRPRVVVVGRDGTGLAGDLRSVGQDVLVLRLADGGSTVYVPLAAVAEVVLPAGL